MKSPPLKSEGFFLVSLNIYYKTGIIMAFNQSEKEQIEKMIRKEIKDFMDSNTVKQFENKLIDVLKKEIKDGKLRKDVRSVVSDVMVDFYRLMWTRRSFWEPDIRK